MAWVLDSGEIRIPIKGTLVVGRSHFPEDGTLSRKHAELSVVEGAVFVTDLGSANGTFLRGRKLAAHDAMKLSEGDRLRIGKTEFVLQTVEDVEIDHFRITQLAIAFGIILCATLAIVRPSTDYGKAFTPSLLLLTLAVVSISVLLAAVFWNFVLSHKQWNPRFAAVFCALVVGSGGLGAVGIWRALDSDWQIGYRFTQAKIEHFCLDRFDYGQCKSNIELCHACTAPIDESKKRKMDANLQEAERGLASPSTPSK